MDVMWLSMPFLSKFCPQLNSPGIGTKYYPLNSHLPNFLFDYSHSSKNLNLSLYLMFSWCKTLNYNTEHHHWEPVSPWFLFLLNCRESSSSSLEDAQSVSSSDPESTAGVASLWRKTGKTTSYVLLGILFFGGTLFSLWIHTLSKCPPAITIFEAALRVR